MHPFNLLLAAGLAAVKTGAAPSPASLGSSITHLFQNDLNITTTAQHNGALLLDPRTHQAAVSGCAALSESLLAPNGSFFTGDFTNLLNFLTFEKKFPQGQDFWVANAADGACQVLSTGARISRSSCARVLPALCSQSAPFRFDFDQDPATQFQVTVKSQGLSFTGFRDKLSFRFLGIRYGNTPERWTDSTLFTPGTQTEFSATQMGSQCVQTGSGGSEDCLFLNIFSPFLPTSEDVPASELKPVMLHYHGGAFTGGSANDGTFDGGMIVSRGDVVEVNTNYRLSTIGFLALADGQTNGNFGISDQVTALDWVRTHIRAFGGDPDRITILGQSAGAASVRILMGSPQAIGKFAAAIPMSNLGGIDFATQFSLYPTIAEEVEMAANPIIQATGCNETTDAATLACLKAVPAETLVNLEVNGQAVVARFVVVDGKFVVHNQLAVDGSAPIAHVPVMMGIMRDDGAPFIGFPKVGQNAQQAVAGIPISSPSPASIVASPLFPTPQNPNVTLGLFNLTSRIATDSMFRCVDHANAITATEHNIFPSLHFYQFDTSYQTPGFDPNAPTCDAPGGDTTQPFFHCHSGELFFVWGSLGQAGLPFRNANDLKMTQLSMDTWTAFARQHDPNPDPAFLAARGYTETAALLKESGPWPAVGPQNNDRLMRSMQIPPANVAFEEEQQCAFLGFPFTLQSIPGM